MSRSNQIAQTIARSPILWGVVTSTGFYGLVRAGVVRGEYVDLYFAGHPVEYMATTMFLVAVAVLAIKVLGVLAQRVGLGETLLGPPEPTGDAAADGQQILARLDRLPAYKQNHYLVRRLRELAEHVGRRGSADDTDDQLKYLADLDAERLHTSFALVRVIIWAIPMLGFLGTVIGITIAIANLVGDGGLGAIENAIPQVVGGLSVAFATTTQALVLAIVLMFAQYYVERQEAALLGEVDQRAAAELAGRFLVITSGPDGQVAAIRQMAESVVQSSERLVVRQADLWQKSLDAAAARWTTMADSAGEKLQRVLAGALAESLQAHAARLGAAEQAAAAEARRHWDRLQQTQVQNTHAMASLQAAVSRQAEVLAQAVEAAGEVGRLEETLNRNLAALAGSKHFEQTVMSLAAAIHLLNARLADGAAPGPAVRLEPGKRSGQAA